MRVRFESKEHIKHFAQKLCTKSYESMDVIIMNLTNSNERIYYLFMWVINNEGYALFKSIIIERIRQF